MVAVGGVEVVGCISRTNCAGGLTFVRFARATIDSKLCKLRLTGWLAVLAYGPCLTITFVSRLHYTIATCLRDYLDHALRHWTGEVAPELLEAENEFANGAVDAIGNGDGGCSVSAFARVSCSYLARLGPEYSADLTHLPLPLLVSFQALHLTPFSSSQVTRLNLLSLGGGLIVGADANLVGGPNLGPHHTSNGLVWLLSR